MEPQNALVTIALIVFFLAYALKKFRPSETLEIATAISAAVVGVALLVQALV